MAARPMPVSLAMSLLAQIALFWVGVSVVVAVMFGVLAARLQDRRRYLDRRLGPGDRRRGVADRRIGLPDTRPEPIERRMATEDRRAGPRDRRRMGRRRRPSMA
jgi:hypothetical protein